MYNMTNPYNRCQQINSWSSRVCQVGAVSNMAVELINYSKTKEMLLGPLSKLNIPPLVINYNSIEYVCGFKLLGVYISNDLSWNLHVDCICARASARLHYLIQLHPSSVANPMWHQNHVLA